MTQAPILLFSAARAGLLPLGGALWAQFGDGVFFDWVAASMAGCLF